MIAAVRYRAPESIESAIELLADDPKAVVLGGGTWVLPQLHRRELSASTIVDLRRLGLDQIGSEGGAVRIGPAVTYSALADSDIVATSVPLLARMAGQITGGVQLRNQGTIGGSACYATPSSDVPACLVALGAELELRGQTGVRRLAAREFFRGPFATARQRDELLTAIVVAPDTRRWAYEKLKLCQSSWPIATAAAVATDDGAEVTLGAVAAVPLWLSVGAREEVGELVAERLDDPWDDLLAPAEYRRRVAPALARRARAQLNELNGDRDG